MGACLGYLREEDATWQNPGDEEKGQVRAGLWVEALETALNRGIGWALKHLPDLWKGWKG